MTGLLEDALIALCRAQERLQAAIEPRVPLPRPRVFTVAPGVVWPHLDGDNVHWDDITVPQRWGSGRWSLPGGRYGAERLAVLLANACGHQPRRILRAVRRLQAATAWCEARAEGRCRAAQEILRQQRRAVEALEAMAAMRALAGGQAP